MEITGIKAIVTGGGSGFGKGIAEALSVAGAKVWITGRSREKLFAAAEEIGVQAFVADASDGKDWDRRQTPARRFPRRRQKASRGSDR